MRHYQLVLTPHHLRGELLHFIGLNVNQLPGTVITRVPDDRRRYIGTPAIVALDTGVLVASHDLFGEDTPQNETHVYRSADRGATWHQVAMVTGQWWSSLFVVNGALYLIGENQAYGDVVIRRSLNEGETWTCPSAASGTLLRGQYHSSATAVVVNEGRVWRAVERRRGADKYDLESMLLSAPAESELLHPSSWDVSAAMSPPIGLRWLEGNAVVTRAGDVSTMLRTRPDYGQEQAALLNRKGRVQLISLPGGAKKFTVRLDEVSDRYLALTNPSPPGGYPGEPDLARIRNRLWVYSSRNLKKWTPEIEVMGDNDWRHTGFQYADWIRIGNRLAVVVRTAYRTPVIPTLSAMASNVLVFYWVEVGVGLPLSTAAG